MIYSSVSGKIATVLVVCPSPSLLFEPAAEPRIGGKVASLGLCFHFDSGVVQVPNMSSGKGYSSVTENP